MISHDKHAATVNKAYKEGLMEGIEAGIKFIANGQLFISRDGENNLYTLDGMIRKAKGEYTDDYIRTRSSAISKTNGVRNRRDEKPEE